jgi:hypothetical protein
VSNISIREKRSTGTGFEAELILDGRFRYTVAIVDPFAAESKREQQLEWYFEEWIRLPFLDTTIAQRAAASVTEYGKYLFEQVFADRTAYGEYANLRQPLSDLQIEIEGSPEFQGLHWEALRDPQLPRPLAVDCVIVRKNLTPQVMPARIYPSTTINVLVVVARSGEERDVGYRTISRPLVEMIETAKLHVQIDILRPGTYEALDRHLDEKPGFYHILHFDLHGAVLSYDQVKKGVEREHLLYQRGYGLKDL